jgi:hypothetical protein
MLRYQDFVPKQTRPAAFFSPAEHESFDAALAAANDWIKENDIRVLNVETVVLPNIWARFEQGSTDPALVTDNGVPVHWHQFIRVWYEVGVLTAR